MLDRARPRSVWLPGAGVRLHAVTAGDPKGPPVLLLHGFPEFWYGWRNHIGPLARAGFHVVALDQRGYNRSEKPRAVSEYAMPKLVADVVACLDALDLPRAAVVGHDWGGGVAWALALARPDRVSRLAVANCPHPRAMRAVLEGSWGQLARSWYMFAAQVPGLPEAVARWTDYGFLARSMRRSARPGAFTHRALARYRAAWARPGAIRGMVNWYRAAFRYPGSLPDGRVRVPTLLLWGARDAFLGRELAPLSAAMCDHVRVERFPDCGHWLLHEEPERTAGALLGFLRPNVVTCLPGTRS